MTEPGQTIAPTERLSRYIIERNKMKPSEHRARHTAFMPPPNRKLSVYRTSDLEEGAIWEIGRTFVAGPLNKTLYARADLEAGEVTTIELRVEPAVDAHPRHANIVGWPLDDSEVLQRAIELAQRAKLTEVPDARP